MIYSFYDPEHEARTGLGNFIILDHIRRAAEAGLPYVYLGYWVEGSQRMQYKIRYRPLERLGPNGWQRLTDAEQSDLIAAVSSAPRTEQPCIDGAAKDEHKQFKFA
jgi:arginine-tRNA-protein transferase